MLELDLGIDNHCKFVKELQYSIIPKINWLSLINVASAEETVINNFLKNSFPWRLDKIMFNNKSDNTIEWSRYFSSLIISVPKLTTCFMINP